MLNFDDEETYFLLVDICNEFGVFPSSSIDTEDYFRNLLSTYPKADFSPDEVASWLQENLAESFISIGESPKWIQSAQWAFFEGKPMIFAGQVDIPVPNKGEIYHDNTSLYIFIDKRTSPVVVLQQY